MAFFWTAQYTLGDMENKDCIVALSSLDEEKYPISKLQSQFDAVEEINLELAIQLSTSPSPGDGHANINALIRNKIMIALTVYYTACSSRSPYLPGMYTEKEEIFLDFITECGKATYLEYLAVLPEFQRTGAGSALIKQAELDSLAAGSNILFAVDFGRDNHRFYKKNGFEFSEPHFYWKEIENKSL